MIKRRVLTNMASVLLVTGGGVGALQSIPNAALIDGKTQVQAGAYTQSGKQALNKVGFYDLTHPIPTFEPIANDRVKPDLSKPIGNSRPIAGFYQQAILYPMDVWPTNQGHFLSRSILLQEHNGTSFNSTNHYWNNTKSLETGSTPNDRRLSSEQISVDQLTGPIVFVDVSARVTKELEKNGGLPSSDPNVTDFSNASEATVRARDIEAVEDKIEDGVWLVARTGWSRFYFMGGEDWNQSLYVNSLNHPGFTPEAIDKLIEIMDRKGVKIAGIAADSLSGDSGEGAKGQGDNWENAWQAHVRLFQRDILVVESLANLGNLATANRGDNCSLIVGALNHIGGTGGPARVIAMCQEAF